MSLLRTVYTRLLPGFAKRLARSSYLAFSAARYRRMFPGDQCRCNFCGFSAGRFIAGGYDHPVLIDKQVIGGGPRPNARCPKCFSLDRERQILVVLSELPLDQSTRVLHVAPEKNLNAYLRDHVTPHVSECDLQPEYYSWAQNISKQDLTALTYDDASFDLVMCNHVFEHIPADIAALSELHRILKPGGFAILQIPYSESIPEIEEDFELDEQQQLARFGQVSHVRIYTKQGFIDRAAGVGLLSRFVSADDVKQHAHLAFDPREGVFLFQKP